MPLPFLKDDNFSTSEPVKTVMREPDGDQPEFDVLDAIVADFFTAIKTQSPKLLKEVLGALLETAREQDEKQDSTSAKGE
jgi:hypothetical protein